MMDPCFILWMPYIRVTKWNNDKSIPLLFVVFSLIVVVSLYPEYEWHPWQFERENRDRWENLQHCRDYLVRNQ